MADDELNNGAGLSASISGCNGIVLVHGGPDCDERASRLLSWYDADAHIAPHEEQCACSGDAGSPDPACPRCHGKGRWLALDNPDAKFTSARRVAAWREWDVSELATFASGQCLVVVTPDGEWHARGTLAASDWSDEVHYLLSDHAHFVALGYRFALVGSD